MIDSMDIEEKYRETLEAFLNVRKVFLLSALLFGAQLTVTIGFYSSLGKTLKNVKYATFEDEHYHKGHALTTAIWCFLFIAMTIVSIWSNVWILKGLIKPLSTLEGVVEGFKMPAITVNVPTNLYKFVEVAALIVLIVLLVMHYLNCDKLVESHEEHKEVIEAKVEETKEEQPKELQEEVKDEPQEEDKAVEPEEDK